jgi:hypothetical protein
VALSSASQHYRLFPLGSKKVNHLGKMLFVVNEAVRAGLASCAAGAEGSNGALGNDRSDLASAGRESVQGFQLAGQRSLD